MNFQIFLTSFLPTICAFFGLIFLIVIFVRIKRVIRAKRCAKHILRTEKELDKLREKK